MTTVTYRNGVMCSDSGISHGNTSEMFMDKIAKNSRGHLCGAAGAADWVSNFLAWFMSDDGAPPLNECTDRCYLALVVEAPNKVLHYSSIRNKTDFFRVKGPYHAIGSGSDIAYGAMFAGASAERAVQAALRHDGGTHGRIQRLRFGK